MLGERVKNVKGTLFTTIIKCSLFSGPPFSQHFCLHWSKPSLILVTPGRISSPKFLTVAPAAMAAVSFTEDPVIRSTTSHCCFSAWEAQNSASNRNRIAMMWGIQGLKKNVTATSHERHNQPNHWRLGCLFNSLFMNSTMKTSNPCNLSSLWWESIGDCSLDYPHEGPIIRKAFP